MDISREYIQLYVHGTLMYYAHIVSAMDLRRYHYALLTNQEAHDVQNAQKCSVLHEQAVAPLTLKNKMSVRKTI